MSPSLIIANVLQLAFAVFVTVIAFGPLYLRFWAAFGAIYTGVSFLVFLALSIVEHLRRVRNV